MDLPFCFSCVFVKRVHFKRYAEIRDLMAVYIRPILRS